MGSKQHFELLAAYNQWMNAKLYEAAGQLSDQDLKQNQGAFFGSVLGTLNHILVGDILWLKRFSTYPLCQNTLQEVTDFEKPKSLNQILFDDLTSLSTNRIWLDQQIINFIAGLSENDFDFILKYQNTKGIAHSKAFSSLLIHFFNHQTHHRGQVSTLLSQAGIDVGVTDLLAVIPNEP